MAKRKNDPPGSNRADGFESSLAKLEAIVEAMESEQLPLEELVKHYEEGSALLRACDSFLHAARERISLITLHAADEAAGPDKTTDVAGGAGSSPSDDHDDDDIRLF